MLGAIAVLGIAAFDEAVGCVIVQEAESHRIQIAENIAIPRGAQKERRDSFEWLAVLAQNAEQGSEDIAAEWPRFAAGGNEYAVGHRWPAQIGDYRRISISDPDRSYVVDKFIEYRRGSPEVYKRIYEGGKRRSGYAALRYASFNDFDRYNGRFQFGERALSDGDGLSRDLPQQHGGNRQGDSEQSGYRSVVSVKKFSDLQSEEKRHAISGAIFLVGLVGIAAFLVCRGREP